MDEELQETLSKHWDLADRKIRRIEDGKPNYWIKNQSYYLNPPVIKDITPLDNERGELEHFKRIRTDLARLLKGDTVKYTYHFNGAPEEIKQILDKS